MIGFVMILYDAVQELVPNAARKISKSPIYRQITLQRINIMPATLEQDGLEKALADSWKDDPEIPAKQPDQPAKAAGNQPPAADSKPPAQSDAPPPSKDSTAAERNWDALKKKHADELDEWKLKHDATTKALTERETEKAALAQEREQARADARKYEAQFKAVAIEKSPEFKQKFDEPIKASMERIGARAGESAKELHKLLSIEQSPKRDNEIAQLVSQLPVFSQTLIANEVNRVDELRAGRNSEIARANQNWEAFEKEQNEARIRQADAQRQGWNNTLDSTIAELGNPTTGIPLFQKRDGDADFNAAVDADIAAVKQLFNGNVAPRDMVKTAALGVGVRRLALQLQSTATELAKAKEHIAKLEAADPSIGNTAKEGRNGNDNEDPLMRIANHAMSVGAGSGRR